MRDNNRTFAPPLRVARDVIHVPMSVHDPFQIFARGLFDQAAHYIGLLRIFEGVNGRRRVA